MVELILQLTAVIAVLALAAAGALLVRRPGWAGLQGRSRQRRMEVKERLMLNSQVSLQLVRIGTTDYLLAVCPGGATVIDRLQADRQGEST